MAALHFLQRTRPVKALFFHHGTSASDQGQMFLEAYCRDRGTILEIGQLRGTRVPGQSWEQFWRDERYAWLSSYAPAPIVFAHHVNDAVETWVFTALRGRPTLIPFARDPNVVRPFLLTSRSDIDDYVIRNAVPYVDDPSNEDVHHTRNYIRHVLMPHALHVNPGLETTIRNRLLEAWRTRHAEKAP